MLSIEILTWTEKYLVYIFCCPPVCRCFSSQSWPLDGSPFLSIGTIIISQNQYELTFVLLYFCCCCFRSTFFPALFFLMYSSTIRHSNRFLVCPGSKSMDQIKIVLKIRSSTAFPLSAFVYVCVYFAQEISINWIKKITEAFANKNNGRIVRIYEYYIHQWFPLLFKHTIPWSARIR